MTSIEHTPVAGQVAVVTGGGRGIGRAIALSLADAGASVAVLARSAAEIDEVAGQVERDGGTAFAATVDVTDQESVRSAMDAVTDQLGAVDLLVNNAGSNAAVGPAWEVDPGQWWWDVTVNLLGPFLCARAVLASMVERGRGRIVNVASGTAGRAFPFDTAYACSKAALVRLTDSLAAETRDQGVSVFALSPGNVDTRLNREVRESEAGQRWMGDVWENMPPSISAGVAARAVVFLAGGEGDALSGRWLDARQDLAALASRAEAIIADDLYQLRLVREAP